MSNVAFSAKFDEFVRIELFPVVGSKAFQLSIELIFDHGEPIVEDREHPIFSSDQISPHLPNGVIDKANKIQSTTERLMWHRSTNV